MKASELESIVKAGQVISFDPDRRYLVVIERAQVPHAVTSDLGKQLRRMGLKTAVLVVERYEGKEPPVQVFEMKADA